MENGVLTGAVVHLRSSVQVEADDAAENMPLHSQARKQLAVKQLVIQPHAIQNNNVTEQT
jgi:hypothetical protein